MSNYCAFLYLQLMQGKSNPKAVYIMRDDVGYKRDIEQTNLERDLVITVDNNLN